jgi:hypothetical protein
MFGIDIIITTIDPTTDEGFAYGGGQRCIIIASNTIHCDTRISTSNNTIFIQESGVHTIAEKYVSNSRIIIHHKIKIQDGCQQQKTHGHGDSMSHRIGSILTTVTYIHLQ